MIFRFKFIPFAAMALSLLASSALPAGADTALKVDMDHTSASFTLAHLTITKVTGYIPLREVKIVVGANAIPTSSEASFDLSKIDSHNESRDNDLRSEKFFDLAKHPVMTFKSTKITPGPNNTFVMLGDLTMHGVTKPVTLQGKVEGEFTDGKGRKHIGYTASGVLDRTQWLLGSAYPPAIVGHDVSLNLQAEGVAL